MASHSTSPSILQLSEWRTAELPGATLSDADRRLADALREGEGRLVVDELRTGLRVTSRSWIGVVRFEACEIRVVPKVVGGNLGVFRMIDYVRRLDALKRLQSQRTLDVARDGSLVDLLGLLLAETTNQLVRDGVLSDYVVREETLTTMRGRLRIAEQYRRRFGQIDRLECQFDEHETDIVENQLLSAGLGIARRVCTDPEVRRQLARFHTVMSEVCDTSRFEPDAAALALNEYNRRNERYRPSHELAWLFVRSQAVTDLYSPGSGTSFAFLLDMNLLFERFVTRLLQDALAGTGIQVHAQYKDTSLIVEEPLGRRYAAVIPDVLLEWQDDHGRKRLPIDAKYKLYDENKLDPADVYQTFFYAYAYARPVDHAGDDVRAAILYPATSGGRGTSLKVLSSSGATSARIHSVGIAVDQALAQLYSNRVALRQQLASRLFVGNARAHAAGLRRPFAPADR